MSLARSVLAAWLKRLLATVPEHFGGVFVAIESAVVTNMIGNNHVELLVLQLAQRIVTNVFSLCGKTDRERSIVKGRNGRQDILRAHEFDSHLSGGSF